MGLRSVTGPLTARLSSWGNALLQHAPPSNLFVLDELGPLEFDRQQGWAADLRRTRHIDDFTQWKDQEAYQRACTHLLPDLKASELKRA